MKPYLSDMFDMEAVQESLQNVDASVRSLKEKRRKRSSFDVLSGEIDSGDIHLANKKKKSDDLAQSKIVK